MGVIPQEMRLRPLGLSRPSTWGCRQQQSGSRPRCIGVSEGLAREAASCGCQCLLAELAEGVVAALEQLAGDRQARPVATDALGGLQVVVAVRAAGVTGDLGGLVQRPAQRGWSLAGEMPGRAPLV